MGAPLPKEKRLSAYIADARFDIDVDIANFTNPEDAYCQLAPREHRKRYGQFFTPAPTARLMAEWVCAIKPKRIFDPAVGTGALLRAAHSLAPNAELTGWDIDSRCLNFAAQCLPGFTKLHNADYLTSQDAGLYEGIIANPPYIRHHDVAYDFDIHGRFSSEHQINISRLANTYILFTLKALSRLAEGGRAAFLIPAEWANANFGDCLKRYFLKHKMLAKVIYFSHSGFVFDDNYSTGCVLLLEKGGNHATVDTYYIDQEISLSSLDDVTASDGIRHHRFRIEELAAARKWDHLLSNGRQEAIKGLVPLRLLATTKRGIATGANAYFHMSMNKALQAGLSDQHLEPCIGKARHVVGYAFKNDDLARLRKEDREILLVDFKASLTAADKKYIAQGEAESINERYLTKARTPWFSMEQQTPAPIWAAVFGRSGMRFIVNEARIKNLTTFHCIYPHDTRPVFIKALAACLNSQHLQERARSKNRVYGGGLLKYEPKDLLEIEAPDLTMLSDNHLERLAVLFDEAERASRIGEVGFSAPGLEEAVEDAIKEAALSFLI